MSQLQTIVYTIKQFIVTEHFLTSLILLSRSVAGVMHLGFLKGIYIKGYFLLSAYYFFVSPSKRFLDETIQTVMLKTIEQGAILGQMAIFHHFFSSAVIVYYSKLLTEHFMYLYIMEFRVFVFKPL